VSVIGCRGEVPRHRRSRRALKPSVILSQHSRYKVTCECNEEDINDDDETNYEVTRHRRSRRALTPEFTTHNDLY